VIRRASWYDTSGPRSLASRDISAMYVGTALAIHPIPKPQTMRPAMILRPAVSDCLDRSLRIVEYYLANTVGRRLQDGTDADEEIAKQDRSFTA